MSKRKSASVDSGDRYDDKAIILKVAGLIEQGSDGMMQITGHYFATEKLGCCAMGALIRGLGTHWYPDTAPMLDVRALLGIASWPQIPYPKGFGAPFAANEVVEMASLPDVIIFLNDRLGWSFSKIVDYLRDCTLPQAMVIKVKE